MTSIKDGRGTQKPSRASFGGSYQGHSQDASAGPRPARKPDPDSCPPGYDPAVWSLALLFRQTAQKTIRRETTDQHIILAHGLPLIYVLLERATPPFREHFAQRQEKVLAGTARPFWLGRSVKTLRLAETWDEVVAEAIRYHFREYFEDEYAADYFCNPEVFRTMIREVREKGWLWHLRQVADAREEETSQ
jgi:hypothetical protein